jgi:hypothetical protein
MFLIANNLNSFKEKLVKLFDADKTVSVLVPLHIAPFLLLLPLTSSFSLQPPSLVSFPQAVSGRQGEQRGCQSGTGIAGIVQ